MVVTKYLTVLSGKYPANLYWIPDSAGCLNFTGYRIPVSGTFLVIFYGYVVNTKAHYYCIDKHDGID
jgi:hypothetical protein